MDIRTCYEMAGGNYDEVLGRMMGKETLVQRFLLRFLDDPSYGEMCKALDAGDAETAFRMAHTLKGCSQNVGLTVLGESASALTEALRGLVITPEVPQLRQKVEEDYTRAADAIGQWKAGLDG